MKNKPKAERELTKLIFLGMLVSLRVVLSRFTVGPTLVKVGFSFVADALLGYFYSPFWAGVGGGASDLISSALFGQEGGFFFGFTLSAIAAPVIYSLFLGQGRSDFWRIFVSTILVTIIVNIGLNTLWLHLMYGLNYKAALLTRLAKELIVPWFQMLILTVLFRALSRVKIEKYFG